MSNVEEECRIHKEKGNEYFKQQNYTKAVEEFTKCIDLKNDDHVLYSNRSGAYAQLHKYNEALQDAQKCIDIKPDWPKGYSRKGLALFHLGRHEEAEETYQKGLKFDPNNEALKEGLANVQNASDSYADMHLLASVIRTIKNDKKLSEYAEDPNYYKQLVEILKQIKKNPNAIKTFLNQPDARLREGLMAVLGLKLPEDDEEEERLRRRQQEEIEKRKKEEMEKKKKEEAAKTPAQIEAEKCKEKGNELYKQKKFDEALEMYDKAISLYPNDLTFNNNKAAVYLEQKEYEKCLEECEKAIEKRYEVKADFTTVAKLYARMGTCCMKMKDFVRAIEMYEKSLLEDNNRHIRNCLRDAERAKHKADEEAFINPEIAEEHRQKGNEFFKNLDYPNAKKEYDLAIKRNPKDAKLYSNRAAALTKLVEFPSALADTEKCLELDPTFVKGWIRKGNLHMCLKEYNKAIQAYDKGLKLQPDNQECLQGKANVMIKIQQMNSSGEVDEEQFRHAMADPEIQQILSDPQFNIILKKITENPASLQEYLKDPKVADGIQKLMMAGILRTA